MPTLESLFALTLKASIHGAILIVPILGIQCLFKKQLTPHWHHALWFVLLIRLAIPATPSSSLSPLNLVANDSASLGPLSQLHPNQKPLPTESHNEIPSPVASPGPILLPKSEPQSDPASPAMRHPISSSINVKRIAAVTWILIGFLMFLRLLVQNWRFIARIRQCQSLSSGKAKRALRDATNTLQMQSLSLDTIQTAHVRTPCIFGLWKPRLLLPEGLVKTLSARELEWVFLHELSHLKRHDIKTSWVLSILQCLHWFNPFIWLAFDQIRADRELATDDLVLQHTNPSERLQYGETIIKLLNQLSHSRNSPAGVVGIVEGKQRIKQRIERIANFTQSKRGSIFALILSLGVILTAMLDAKSTDNSSVETESENRVMQVRELNSNQPIANSQIELRIQWWNESKATYESRDRNPLTARTDELGRATLESVPTDARRYVLKVSHPDFLTTTKIFNSERNPMPDPERLFLVKGQRISGRVTDESNQPIENAQVLIRFPHGVEDFFVEPPKKPIPTDSNGRWSTKSVPPNTPEVFISVTHPTYAVQPRTFDDSNSNTKIYNRNQLFSLKTLIAGDHITTMQRGGILRGTVFDHHDAPLSKARIELRGAGQDAIETDGSGKFEFKSALVGPVAGVIASEGFSPLEFTLEINPETEAQEYRLRTGSELKLRFIDTEGAPVEGVRIHVSEWSGKRYPFRNQSNHSGEKGMFTWTNAPDGAITFDFIKNGFRSIRDRILEAGDAVQEIRMESALKIRFEVTDSENNAIKSFTIDRGQPRQLGPDRETVRWSPRDRKAGTNGIAQATESDPVVFRSQAERSYIYRVEAPGYQSATSRIVDAGEHEVTLKFQLEKATSNDQRLETIEGQALSGRTLWLLAENNSYAIDASMASLGRMGAETLRTDAAGNFELPKRNSIHYVLGLFDDGFVFAPATQASRFVVEPWTRLEGTWTEGGKPIEGQTIGFTLTERFHTARPILHFRVRAKTDKDGKFTFPKVPPKEIDILNWAPVGNRTQTGLFVATMKAEIGGTRQLAINLPQRHRVSGQIKLTEELLKITDLDGSMGYIMPILPDPPLPEEIKSDPTKVRTWYQEWYKTPEGEQHRKASRQGSSNLHLESDGTFQTPRIRPGSYRIQFHFVEKQEPSQRSYNRQSIAYALQNIEINSSSPEVIDLGEIEPIRNTAQN